MANATDYALPFFLLRKAKRKGKKGSDLSTTSDDQALPAFKADMLPNEIEELTESWLVKSFKEGWVVAQTCRLRPHRFAEHNGLLFDMEAADSDGLAYRGITGVLIVEKKLYLIFFLGAEPYRYDKHIDEALVVIQAAHI